jgi:hypothetical protein
VLLLTEELGVVMMYEIVVRGEAGPAVRSEFDDLVVSVGDGETTLRGDLADQPAIYGVLARAQDLGLELVEVCRLGPRLGTEVGDADLSGG